MITFRRLVRITVFSLFMPTTAFVQSSQESTDQAQAITQRRTATMNKHLKEGWHKSTCKLLRQGEKKPSAVESMSAVYEVEVRDRTFQNVSLTAFLAPMSGSVWIGPEQEYYLENGAAIIGLQMRGGSIFWCESLSKDWDRPPNAGQKIRDVIMSFERKVSGADLIDAQMGRDPDARLKRTTSLRRTIMNPWFFAKAPFSSQAGNLRIVDVEIENGELKLELTDETGKSNATVWVDIRKKQALRSVEEASAKK